MYQHQKVISVIEYVHVNLINDWLLRSLKTCQGFYNILPKENV